MKPGELPEPGRLAIKGGQIRRKENRELEARGSREAHEQHQAAAVRLAQDCATKMRRKTGGSFDACKQASRRAGGQAGQARRQSCGPRLRPRRLTPMRRSHTSRRTHTRPRPSANDARTGRRAGRARLLSQRAGAPASAAHRRRVSAGRPAYRPAVVACESGARASYIWGMAAGNAALLFPAPAVFSRLPSPPPTAAASSRAPRERCDRTSAASAQNAWSNQGGVARARRALLGVELVHAHQASGCELVPMSHRSHTLSSA